MNKTSLEIIVPIYNEGDKVLRLLQLFQKNIKINFKVFFCYDLENDDIFEYKDNFKKFNFDIQLIKNPSTGPCSAIVEGFFLGNSDWVDSGRNANILNKAISKPLAISGAKSISRFAKRPTW